MQSAPATSLTSSRDAIVRGFRSFPSFCALLQVRDKTGKRVPFRLNRTQRKWVATRTNRDVCLKGRQVGLTTVILALMVYRFLTVPGARVVVVCQAMAEDKNVKEISTTIDIFLQSLEARGLGLDFKTRTTTSWELDGRDAKLDVVTAGASEDAADKKFRSRTVTHLHCTEMAYWEYADATLRGALNSVPPEEFGSEVVMECTANGAAGPFYEYCEQARRGEGDYAFHFYPWFSHEEYRTTLEPGEHVAPRTAFQRLLVEKYRLTPEQLKYWQSKVAEARGDEDFVNQELPSDPDTCFLVSGRSFFDAAQVGAMLAKATEPIRTQEIHETGITQMRDGKSEVPAIRVWHEPVPGRDYVVSCDPSSGTGGVVQGSAGSAGGSTVFERGTGRHMATLWGQFPEYLLAKYSVAVARKYNGALLVVERNNHGGTVLRAALAEQHYVRIFEDRDERPGWNTTPASRPVMLDTLAEAVRAKHFQTNDIYLLREMRTFIIDERGKPIHAKGARDDLVMTAGIGWDVVCRSMPKKPSLGGVVA
jgi:hypothetical protein